MSEAENIDLVRRFCAAWEKLDVAAIMEFFTDDATFVDPAWGRVEGIENIKRFLVESMAGLEDWSFPRQFTAVDGDRLVSGWQNRLPGRRPDGSPYQALGISVLVYAGGGTRWGFDYFFIPFIHLVLHLQ